MFQSKDIVNYEMEFSKEISEDILLYMLQFDDIHIHLNKHVYTADLEEGRQIQHFVNNHIDLEKIKNFYDKFIAENENNQELVKNFKHDKQDISIKEYDKYFKYYQQNLSKLEQKIEQLLQTIESYENSKQSIQDLKEHQEVYHIFSKNFETNMDQQIDYSKVAIKLKNMAGTIDNKNLLEFQRILFRLTRGNHQQFFQNLKENDQQNNQRTLFIITFFDTSNNQILQRLELCAKKLEVQIYSLQQFLENRQKSLIDVDDNLKSTKKYQQQIKDKLISELNYFFSHSTFNIQRYISIQKYLDLKIGLLKLKQQINTSNYFCDIQIFIKKEDQENFVKLIDKIQNEVKQPISLTEINNINLYPTIYMKNEFTLPFLYIDEIYTIPKYKEVNPAYFGTVFFPFMFGLMFGDTGHGILLILLALSIFYFENYLQKEIKQLKWFFLFLGFFSFYCGLIYNEFFGVPLLIQRSCYHQYNLERKNENCVYGIGIDYIWFISTNENQFINSFKMKTSIIFGVIHMILGLLLNLYNCIIFKKFVDMFFVTLPKIIFMISIFGYMSFCIIYKWFQNYQGIEDKAPSIISLFINFLNIQQDYLILNPNYQLQLHKKLALIALISTLIMFFLKPICIIVQYLFTKKQNINHEYQELNFENQDDINLIEEDHKEQHEDVSGHVIEHFIECIEFLLGSISNTASYLRLWALSLAHTQLSSVFLQMLILGFMNKGIIHSTLGICIAFPFFLATHIIVLMIMDFMECMLHALRLHWVEFQSKFVIGNGIKFINIHDLILVEQ